MHKSRRPLDRLFALYDLWPFNLISMGEDSWWTVPVIGYCSFSRFGSIMQTNKQTNTPTDIENHQQTPLNALPPRLSTAWVLMSYTCRLIIDCALLSAGIDQILHGATSPTSRTPSSYHKPTSDLVNPTSLDLPEGYSCRHFHCVKINVHCCNNLDRVFLHRNVGTRVIHKN